jgi:TRAP-type C4-dicarboxylate transport system substrate-binding protein
VVFHGGTLLGKELEIMDAVKSGNIAIGTPVGAACTVFPEMCVFLTPYLVRDYNHAYSMFNGEIGKTSTRPSRRSTRSRSCSSTTTASATSGTTASPSTARPTSRG